MSVKRDLRDNHASIDKAEADLQDAEAFGDDEAIPRIRKKLEDLIELRGSLVAKQAYLKASGG